MAIKKELGFVSYYDVWGGSKEDQEKQPSGRYYVYWCNPCKHEDNVEHIVLGNAGVRNRTAAKKAFIEHLKTVHNIHDIETERKA